jgi:hypothetical protein
VRAKYEELKVHRPSTTDMKVIEEREETDQVHTFLAVLDSSHEAIGVHILLSTDKLEALRRVAIGTSDLNPKPETHAFSAQHFNTDKTRVIGR